jgi:hypothetical protein
VLRELRELKVPMVLMDLKVHRALKDHKEMMVHRVHRARQAVP